MPNSNINDWTKRQLFNPNTFVLHNEQQENLTVNARPNLGGDVSIFLPMAGSIIGAASFARALTSQTITNVDTPVAWDSDGATTGNAVTRTGSDITSNVDALFSIYCTFHVVQNANTVTSRFWINLNGVAITFYGTTMEMKQSGDVGNATIFGYQHLIVGDVLSVHGIASAANGSALQVLAAASPAPAVTGAYIELLAYLPLPS